MGWKLGKDQECWACFQGDQGYGIYLYKTFVILIIFVALTGRKRLIWKFKFGRER